VVSIHRRPDGSMRRRIGSTYVGPQAVYQPGTRRLKGWQAIDYARQRYTKGGDYTRQRHQRQLVKALLTEAENVGLATDRAKLQHVFTALGDTLVYLGGRTPFEYAYALRNLSPDKVTLVGLPGGSVFSGGGYIGEQLQPAGNGVPARCSVRQPGSLSPYPPRPWSTSPEAAAPTTFPPILELWLPLWAPCQHSGQPQLQDRRKGLGRSRVAQGCGGLVVP
jgi:hypothetical protein